MMKKTYSAKKCYESLKLANEIGNKAAAERLGINLIHYTCGLAKQKMERLVFLIIQVILK